ncbi:MAG: O-antigen ligase family protein [Thermodesulfovibrionales bacterium]
MREMTEHTGGVPGRLPVLRWALFALAGVGIAAVSLTSPWIALLLCGLVAVLLLSTAKPHLPYFLVIPLLSFISIEVRLWGDPKFFFNLAEPLVLFSFLAWRIARGTGVAPPYPKTDGDLPILLLLLWGSASIVWSSERLFGAYYMLMFSVGVCFFFLTVAHLDSFRRVKGALVLFVGMGVINAGMCFYSLLSHDTVEETIYHTSEHFVLYLFNPEAMLRGQGFLHPLATAYYLSLTLVLLLGFLYTSRSSHKRLLLALLSFFVFVAMLTTLSKGPLLSLLFGLGIFTLINDKMKKNAFISWILILSLVVVGFALSRVPTNDFEKALDYTSKTSTQTNDESSSLGSRLKRWKKGMYALFDTYGMGTGSGGFYSYIKPDFAFDNVYVHIIVDYGFIGMWLYLWFLLVAARRFIAAYRKCTREQFRKWMQIYIAGFATLLLNGLTSLTQAFLPIWFYIGIGYALVHVVARESGEENKNGKVVCQA